MHLLRIISFASFAFSLFAMAANAQSLQEQATHSRSGQFIIHPSPFPSTVQRQFQPVPVSEGRFLWSIGNPLTVQTNSRLHLEPPLVAVSCERIKEALLKELDEPDRPSRRIHIQLNSRIRQDEASILPTRYQKGWVYMLEMPVDVDSDYFTAAVLNVLLLDLANQSAAGEQADLPKWLVTGLITQLQATTLASFTLEPNLQIAREYGKKTRYDPLARARERFKNNPPLTFDELSWPDKLDKRRMPFFKDSAHLFVAELLRFKDGKKALRTFLAALPDYKNWQFAFLAAFQNHFTQLVDVEKWWALSQVSFTGRDPAQLWSKEESWKKLKAALDVSVEVHLKSDRMPVAAELSLQEIIQNWDAARQELYIQKALGQLRTIRFRVAPEFVTLVDEYRRILESYLQQRKKSGSNIARKDNTVNTQFLKKSTCRQLDHLDEERSKLRPMLAAAEPKAQ